jgi:hypothetical protein
MSEIVQAFLASRDRPEIALKRSATRRPVSAGRYMVETVHVPAVKQANEEMHGLGAALRPNQGTPFIPAQAAIQQLDSWVPACAGTNGENEHPPPRVCSELIRWLFRANLLRPESRSSINKPSTLRFLVCAGRVPARPEL